MRSVYSLADGVLTGQVITGSLQVDVPGMGQVPGVHDPRNRRVDLQTGEVVAWQPPAPPADDLQTWAWNADTERWVSTPTAAAIARNVRAERDRRLAACDWVTARAIDLGQPVPTAWATYRQALRDVTAQAGFPTTINWPEVPE